jgi:MoaA/NifB/PqqE/SkfB family radical SAM enzyme
VASLREAIADAADEGYSALSVSGGEPLLYPGLPVLLDEAREHGLATAVTTNGTLLDARRLEDLRGRVDLLAISLDGVPESHDRMRSSPGAFAAMEGRLEGLRQAGLPFGFLFTLTRTNAHELGWLADFAAGQGARLLQIHPLAETGRAAGALRGDAPDDFEAAFAWVAAMRLREGFRGRLRIHLDLLDRAALREGPASFPVGGPCGPLADLVTPLVVEADGMVAPLRHGFSRAFALGNLQEARLRFLGARWRAQRSRAFADLCRRTIEELAAPADMPFVNWHEEVARRAAAA